jgi:hypothetical protein
MFGNDNQDQQNQDQGGMPQDLQQPTAPPAGFGHPVVPQQDNQPAAEPPQAPAGFGGLAEPDDAQAAPPAGTDDLLSIKQEALQQLSPLVGHLEQSPEEKFRTLMMMIQAADDQSLLKDAYAAAQQIPDEEAKAKALLDVVNEINYFTQQHHGSQS